MKIQPAESCISGEWIEADGAMVANAACGRIAWLIENELRRIRADESGWYTLYEDPHDGRLWELSYPHSDWHGGGPPKLQCLTHAETVRRFGHFS